MGTVHEISIFDRLEIYHITAYLDCGVRKAQAYRKQILADLETRRSKVLFIADLARYDGFESEEDMEAFTESLKICLELQREREKAEAEKKKKAEAEEKNVKKIKSKKRSSCQETH